MSQDSQSISSEDTRGRGFTASGPDMQTTETRIVPMIQQSLKLTILIVSGLLLMRFLFALFGISRTMGLTSFIISLTDPLVAPFSNIVESSTSITTATFETSALLATIIFCLGGTFIIWLLDYYKSRQ